MAPAPKLARLAFDCGYRVALGMSPEEAAFVAEISYDELVAVRIDYQPDYDRGLECGREYQLVESYA